MLKNNHFGFRAIIISSILLLSLFAKAHNGVFYTVDRLTDNNTLTGEGNGLYGDLRYCITQANIGNDNVLFTFGLTGTIYLQAALPAITNTNNGIYGTNASVTISGQNLYPVFTAAEGAIAFFTDLIITNGFQPAGSDGGSGILNYGDIVINNCIFYGNTSNSSGGAITNKPGALMQIYDSFFFNNMTIGYGGAIHNDTGMMTIDGCLFEYNSSSTKGGAIGDEGTAMVLVNSTFINNDSSNEGTSYITGSDNASGHYIANCTFSANSSSANQPTIANYASLVLVNNTICYNNGSGVSNNGPYLTMINSIVADNGNNNIQGTFTGLSKNNILSSSDNSNIINGQNGNIVNNTIIGILFVSSVPGFYNSEIPTFALTTISPAMNAGIASVAGITIPTLDQRGYVRTDMPDIGSYEYIKSNQSILFTPIGAKVYGDAPFPLTATANSGLPVSFSIIGPGIVSGNTVTITGTGTLTITAYQPGNNLYNYAFYKQIITVSKSRQTITGLALQDVTFPGITLPLNTFPGTTTSGLPLSYSVAGPAFIQNNTLNISGAGVITVTAFQNGNENYLPVTLSTIFTVYKSVQTITDVAPLPNVTLTGSLLPIPLMYSATSGLTVTYSVTTEPLTGVASISGNFLYITGAGAVTVAGLQLGNENYLPVTIWSVFSVTENEVSTGVISEANQQSTIYPNPGNGIFNIKMPSEATALSLKIINQLGEEMLNQVVNDSFFDLSRLNAGIYYACISVKNKTWIEKLVVSP